MSKSDKYSLDACVREKLQAYFTEMGDIEPSGVYQMILKVVEKPMLEVVLEKAEGNQSRAAAWLGINRNTLHKKLADHDLLKTQS